METLVGIPYTVPDFPGPPPTQAQIHTAPLLSQRADIKIVQIDNEYAVKYGPAVQFPFSEGQNTIFVRKLTSVRVPKIYALYSMDDGEIEDVDSKVEINYMVMEFIEGQTLKTYWEILSTDEEEYIVATLKGYFTELRLLPSPGCYGFLGRQPFRTMIFESVEPNPTINGPFETEEDLNEAIILSYAARRPRESCVYETNIDLQCKNIIVKKNDNPNTSGTGRMYEVAVIDWEEAGWYPSYWEYTLAAHASDWENDWPNWLPKMMDPYDLEFAWIDNMHMSYYGGL
ncbi:hypothetical protein MGYG_08039 [Nannizzia gypsea CBS 118893]|uniref:Aminoglycoside phosphotransferase domain-containing protein n=1 Tax=Arthroderma gypseum (strain ATCC MYA-4604 / CBS 118893) TaxID=535722 RepID=E4V4V9_ARTGP|nr:hypothetical protein MGYG_08039 [Nannizzia gypsea CBS 118893]EFR05033.1 hypothetical protein MGYG_08039 [Nannizzia gypsea CBS 118893]